MEIQQDKIIAAGDRAVLRDREPDDLETQLRWFSRGEWLQFDAPWEHIDFPQTAEEREKFKTNFLIHCDKGKVTPRKSAIIASKEGLSLGWVNRYADERFPAVWSIGIDICEDAYLNKGIGTEALRLWIRHLFKNSDIHKIALATWSMNPRMKHVAEKIGFVREGAEREMIKWKGAWHNRIHYGCLRSEWEKMTEPDGSVTS
ncbi:MAG: GNAT family N-acetyltransferase [Candidatus Eisenbacteria bacterium]|uniref:GNAT family N-acetyltransferase n=1 Tax=Eiseniibacteriota bacterium TaxID=2212470 RepID=A0A948RVX3_UNCEI|nr:GNAT family N-acetyltransferase [Candidatus Eisenbacteria bacterium]